MNEAYVGEMVNYLGQLKVISTLAVSSLIILAIIVIVRHLQVSPLTALARLCRGSVTWFGRLVMRKELQYSREVEIGKITDKARTVKIYRFLNDLIIDLGLKKRGSTPYQFLFLLVVAVFLLNLVVCLMLFNSLFMVILMYPIFFAAVICILYTKANLSHDKRIESVIEAENIICNNIKDGVKVAVRDSLVVMPEAVRGEFKDFLDNIEHKNYHIVTALMELNNNLGSVADEFIKKCIVFETEEERGISGMFRDIVEVNNIKMKMRNELKRKFEVIKNNFILSACMIFVFLGGVIAIYPDIREFYFKVTLGQLIIAADALIIIGEFVYITYLRAKEL